MTDAQVVRINEYVNKRIDERLTERLKSVEHYIDLKFAELARQYGILEGQVRALNGELSGLNMGFRGEISGIRSEVVGIRSEISGVKSEFGGLRDKMDALTILYRKQDDELRLIREQNEKIIALLTDRLPPKVEA